MTSINLVPGDLLARRDARCKLRSWVIRLLALIVVLAGAYGGLTHMAATQAAEVRQLAQRYARLQERIGSAETLIQERENLTRRRAATAQLRAGQTAAWFLDALGQALTPESYLSLVALERCPLVIDEEQQPGTPGNQQCMASLRIRGRAPGHRQVGEILRRLSDLAGLDAVTLVSASEFTNEGGPSEVEFEVLCTLQAQAGQG